MKEFDVSLANKLFELYRVYEKYNWDIKENKIIITIGKEPIISLCLYENGKKEDEFSIAFGTRENAVFIATALRLFVMCLGNVMIHKEDNMYLNAKRKPYLWFIIESGVIREMADQIIANQEEKVINLDNEVIKHASELAKKKNLDKRLLNMIDNRIKITDAYLEETR